MGDPQNQSNEVPLARFEVFRSSSCEAVVSLVSRALVDHGMKGRNLGEELDARMNRVASGGWALSHVRQGAERRARAPTAFQERAAAGMIIVRLCPYRLAG